MTFALPLAAGIAAAALLAASARATAFDRDRSFYPTVLCAIALLYVLFGVESASSSVAAVELAVALGFVAVAVVAHRRASAVLLAGGLAAHGLWDLGYPALVPASDAVPVWWPAFCLGVDLPLALFVLVTWPPRS